MAKRRELVVADGGTGTGGRVQVRHARRDGWTKKRREIFLASLAETANVTLSAARADIHHSNAYALRRRDPVFAEGWEKALREGVSHLEMRALERAINGDTKPVFYGGREVGKITTYPDRLAMYLMTRHGRTGAADPLRAEGVETGMEDGSPGSLQRLETYRARQRQARKRLEAHLLDLHAAEQRAGDMTDDE